MKYGLSENPFKDTFDHDIVGEDRMRLLEQLCALLEKSARIPSKKVTGNRNLAVLLGGYGLGKTYTLWYLKERILADPDERKKFMNGDVRLATSNFGLLEGGRLGSKPFLALYQKIVRNLEQKHEGRTFLNRMRYDLEGIAQRRKRGPEELLADVKNPFRSVFLELGEEQPNEFLAAKWLQGERLSKGEMQALGVTHFLDSDARAQDALAQLLKIVAACNYHALVVLVDEAEDILGAGPKAMMQFLTTLRTTWDISGDQASRGDNAAPIVVLSAFSPEAWERLVESAEGSLTKTGGAGYQPFLRRLGDHVFQLEPLTKKDAIQLVQVLLATKRTKARKDALYPFTEDAIEYVADHHIGNPARIIGFCQTALDEANVRGVDRIDKDFAVQILDKQGTFEGAPEAAQTDEEILEEM